MLLVMHTNNSRCMSLSLSSVSNDAELILSLTAESTASHMLLEYIFIITVITIRGLLFSIPHPVHAQECHSQSCILIRDTPEHGDKNEDVRTPFTAVKFAISFWME
jgi:hypothetical protein